MTSVHHKSAVRYLPSLVRVAVAVAICVPSLLVNAQSTLAQGNSRIINGHKVSGRFLEVWSSHGSEQVDVYLNGMPITDAHQEVSLTDGKLYETQWFERARYEAHPENLAPYDILLGLLGASLAEGRPSLDPLTERPHDPGDQPFVKIARPSDADGKSKVWFQETGHSISGKILQYWNKYGGLRQFGFPLSEQFQEVSPTDGKAYTVQYFERNRFELHPEKPVPYDVELGLLGVQQYRTAPVPGEQLAVAPPRGVTSKQDTLTIAVPEEPSQLVPEFEASYPSVVVGDMIFNGSVNLDSKGNYQPGDIYSVPSLENGGAYYVGSGGDRHFVVKEKVRFGLRWSDGAPVTSSDWLYARKLAEDPDSGVGAGVPIPKVYSVLNPDAHTVIYNFRSYNQAQAFYNKPGQDKEQAAVLKPYIDGKRPVDDPQYYLVDEGAPLPEHIMSKIKMADVTSSDFTRNPVGDGPFKLEKWDAGKQIVLVPNPNYSLTAPPLLKRVVVKFIPDNTEVLTQLKSGDLDAAPYLGDPSHAFDALAGSGQTVTYVQQRGWEQIEVNLDRPQFQDKLVRQALITGINRQQIVDSVMLGKTAVTNTFLPPKSWASSDNPGFASVWGASFPINSYRYDPVKANRMLDDAGWIKGSDGIRAKNGVKMVVDYATTQGNPVREQISQLVAADLKNLGVQANLKYIPGSTFFGEQGTMHKRQFDLAQFTWATTVDPNGFDFQGNQIPTPENDYQGQNFSGFKSARFDQLEQASSSEIDKAKRAPVFAEMQHIWNDELPELPLYVRVGVSVHKSNLQNWFDSGEDHDNTPTYTIAAMYFK